MKHASGILIFVCLLFSTPSLSLDKKAKDKTKFGGKITLTDSVSLKSAIKNHSADSKKGEILIGANVQKVCVKKGCWMGIGEDNLEVRVTFKDYGFFVTTRLIGKKVMVQGKLEVKTMSVSEAKHYAKDAGKSKAEIMAITKPINEYRIVASAVEISTKNL